MENEDYPHLLELVYTVPRGMYYKPVRYNEKGILEHCNKPELDQSV